MHLARYASCLTLLVRRPTLAETMSDYLIQEIEAAPNITVRSRTGVVGGGGERRLTSLTLRDRASGAARTLPATALFVLIGAEPSTSWLPQSVQRHRWGFAVTGRDLLRQGGAAPDRPPLPVETSLPGVFGVGDVRSGSVKRVASAVGEGSVAIRLVHDAFTSA